MLVTVSNNIKITDPSPEINHPVKKYVVYRHIFPNGKNYIGITCATPYHRRWRGGTGYCKQPKMYRAILKYGWENIQHEVLYTDLTLDEANRVEQEMIFKFDSVENGYNISIGGGGTFGIPCSEETKRKIGNANRGRPCIHHDNLSRYRAIHGAWNKGGHLTPEQYRKIVAERKARCNKAISAYDPITLECVLHFDSCVDASKSIGVSSACISRCAKGGRKTSGGYIWRYDDEGI